MKLIFLYKLLLNKNNNYYTNNKLEYKQNDKIFLNKNIFYTYFKHLPEYNENYDNVNLNFNNRPYHLLEINDMVYLNKIISLEKDNFIKYSSFKNNNEFLIKVNFSNLLKFTKENINHYIINFENYKNQKYSLSNSLNILNNKIIKQSIFIEELKDKIIELNKIIDESTLYYFEGKNINNNNFIRGGSNIVFDHSKYEYNNNYIKLKTENNKLLKNNNLLKLNKKVIIFYKDEYNNHLLLINVETNDEQEFKAKILIKKEITKDFFDSNVSTIEEKDYIKFNYKNINQNCFDQNENSKEIFIYNEFNKNNYIDLLKEIKNKLKGI